MSHPSFKRWFHSATTFALFTGLALTVTANAEELTAFGAIKGANADGSIPAYTGGLTRPPASFKSGSGVFVDPFANEAPLYTVTAANKDQYARILTPGTQALLDKWSDYKLNVYPTHRTMAYPSWFLENARKNQGNTRLSGASPGDKLENLHPGTPFPRPTNGYEAMWNHLLRYERFTSSRVESHLVDSRGRSILLNRGSNDIYSPVYSGDTSKVFNGDQYWLATVKIESPANLAGYVQLQRHPMDWGKGSENWVFDPGQRRVRVAPNFTYDTPVAQWSGTLFYDEAYGFMGRMDRFDFKLIGRQEMLVPYNTYGAMFGDASKLLGPKFLNPDVVRWEKHRVWVVEATRKNGARHAYSKRRYYLDEDTWAIVLNEHYDNAGKLARVGQMFSFINYTPTGGVSSATFNYYDLIKGNYVVLNKPNTTLMRATAPNPAAFTSQGISGGSNR